MPGDRQLHFLLASNNSGIEKINMAETHRSKRSETNHDERGGLGTPAGRGGGDVVGKSRLRIVSMNVAISEPSRDAPPSWNQNSQQTALRDEILKTGPDIVMLQECPGPKWAEDEMLRGRGFVSVGSPKASHAGYVVLLLKREFFNGERVYPPRQLTSLPRGLPVVAAEVTMPLLRGNGSSASAPSSAR